MNRKRFFDFLNMKDKHKMYVLTLHDIRSYFSSEPEKTFQSAMRRFLQEGLIERACRSVYVNPYAKSKDAYVLEHIAIALRRGEYSYISLESLLSEIGIISQVPLSRLTVMTTGRSQIYHTSYGTIEFTHTAKSVTDILSGTYTNEHRPLRLATKELALRDLRRVNRNLDLIEIQEE